MPRLRSGPPRSRSAIPCRNLPLALTGDLFVPVNFEASYQEACPAATAGASGTSVGRASPQRPPFERDDDDSRRRRTSDCRQAATTRRRPTAGVRRRQPTRRQREGSGGSRKQRTAPDPLRPPHRRRSAGPSHLPEHARVDETGPTHQGITWGRTERRDLAVDREQFPH